MATKTAQRASVKKAAIRRRGAQKSRVRKGRAGRNGDYLSIVVPITTLAPEPFDLLRDIPVVVTGEDDNFLATFYDANLSASGDTPTEAVDNLKDIMVHTFTFLSEQPPERLVIPLTRQLAVLRTVMRPCS